MARIIYSLGELKGSVGNNTFQQNASGKIVRSRPKVKKTSTIKQQVSHASHQNLLFEWSQLTTTNRDDWNTFASVHNKTDKFGAEKTLTGANWFTSCNFQRLQMGLSLLTSPPAYDLPSDAPAFHLILSDTDIQIQIDGSIAWDTMNLNVWGTQPTTRSKPSINRLRKYLTTVTASPDNPFSIKTEWENATGLTWSPLTNFPAANIFICIEVVRMSSGITSPMLCTYAATQDIFVYDADMLAYIAQFVTPPTDPRKLLLNQLFLDLKTAGIFAKLDRFYLYATEDQQQARVSLKYPASAQIVEHNSPTWDVNGYTGNGSSMYLNLQFTPSADGVNFIQDDACYGCYVSTDVDEVKFEMGATAAGSESTFCVRESNTLLCSINNSGGLSYSPATNTNAIGFYSILRDSSASVKIYKNSSLLDTLARVSNGNTNSVFLALAQGVGGTPSAYSTKKQACSFFGAGSINQTDLYNIVTTYLTAIGAI